MSECLLPRPGSSPVLWAHCSCASGGAARLPVHPTRQTSDQVPTPHPCSPLAPFTVGRATGRGAMVRGWEEEAAGWAAEVQHGTAGPGEGVEGGGQGRAELLRVVAGVVLRDHLLQAEVGLEALPPAPLGMAGLAVRGRPWPRAQLPRGSGPSGPPPLCAQEGVWSEVSNQRPQMVGRGRAATRGSPEGREGPGTAGDVVTGVGSVGAASGISPHSHPARTEGPCDPPLPGPRSHPRCEG